MKQAVAIIITIVLLSSCSVRQLTVTPTTSKRGDAGIGSIVPDNNYAKFEDINISAWTQNGVPNINRVFIDFNLDKIPSDAIIESAFLDLYFNPTSAYDKVGGSHGNQGVDKINIRRITSDWNEANLTWNNQPETTRDNQTVVEKLKDPHANYLNIDVRKIVQDMISTPGSRYGIMICHQQEIPYDVVFIASSNHPNEKLHPTLRVKYRSKYLGI